MNERWVTLKDGRKVKIKTTSEYMNDFIRGKGKVQGDEAGRQHRSEEKTNGKEA